MRKRFPFEWERLDELTERAKVIGGWIIKHEKHALAEKGNKTHLLCSESMVFVPDRDHEWHVLPTEKAP